MSVTMDDDDVPESSEPGPSPFSSSDRKRRTEAIENSLKEGKFTEKKLDEHFIGIYDENSSKVDRLRCLKCKKILSSNSGGNKTAHRLGKCSTKTTQNRVLTSSESRSLRNSLVNYIMKSGVSFHHIQSDTFRTMAKDIISIGSNGIDVQNLRIPCEESLRNDVEKRGTEIFKEIGKEISEPVQREECCLVLDFGKKLHDFLSVFIVFIDRKTEKPTIKTLPFMFYPVFENKKTEKIVEYIVEGGERLNLSRDVIINMRLVGDGASNIRKLEKYFRSYSLCSCHSLQKSAERVLDPLEDSHSDFLSQELEHLREIQEAVEECGDLASRLRRYRNHHDLDKLPVAYCKTRWMTFLNCTQDIIDMFPEIDKIQNTVIKKMCDKIRPKLATLITAMQLLRIFEKPLKIFEQTDIRIHEVAPWFFKLKQNFEEQQTKGKQDRIFTIEVVSKAACISLNHYISKTISDTHLLATSLCPGMRKLGLFPQVFKDKAQELLKAEIEIVRLEQTAQKKIDFDHLTIDLYDQPPPAPSADSELRDYESSVFTQEDSVSPPLEFWDKYQNRFPRLAKIAGGVYCTLSSESICERAFSALNRVFRTDRQSLDPEMVEILMISYIYLNNSK